MQLFKINEEYSILCEAKSTRNGFKHEATLLINGIATMNQTKICYLNRTWEAYTYQSVLQKLINQLIKHKNFIDEDKNLLKSYLITLL